VTIVWTRSSSYDAQGYRLFRKNATTGKMEQIYATQDVNDTMYTNQLQLSSEAICYYVSAVDACQNMSPMSNNGCVILLSGKVQSLVNTIDWTAYTTWSNNVKSYNIYRQDVGGWRLIQSVNGAMQTYEDRDLDDKEEKYCYQVEAVENPGGHAAKSKSTVLCLVQPPITWIPNVFTPGYSLNLNDQFAPKGNYIDHYDMQIFNRWGERIYSTFDSKPWDGTYKGRLAQEGVYVYKIIIYGFDGKPQYFDGTVTVMW
jgi:gliding motility-associated-like protein